MIFHTKSGSTYQLDEHGFCTKWDAHGNKVDRFKVWAHKPIPPNIEYLEELWDAPNSDPVVGQRYWVSGPDRWWVTTPVKEISF